MATGGEIQSSTDKNVVKNCPGCSPCSDDGSYTAAGHYCVECELYFCGKCLKCHNKIFISASHQVNAVVNVNTELATAENAADTRPRSIRTRLSETLKCSLHHNQCIDTYCKNDDDVICRTCAVINHRHCTTVDIAIASKNFKTSPAVNDSKDQLNSFITRMLEQRNKRTENQKSIETEKAECIENVDKYEQDMIAKIKQLADNSRQLVRSKYEKYNTAIDREVSDIDSALATLRTYLEKLDTTELEQLLFVIVKTSMENLIDSETFLEEIVADWEEKKIQFHIDEKLGEIFNELGNIFVTCITKYNATFLQNVNIDIIGNDCLVRDVCLMSSGDIFLADSNYSELKRFSSDLQFIDEIKLPIKPGAVCEISEHEVAVREYNSKTVHVVAVGETMEITSSFKLDGKGYGMAYDADTKEIYACENHKVSVYRKTGAKIRTYETDTNFVRIFSACRRIALSENKHDIYVTDSQEGLIVIDKNGTLKLKVAVSGGGDVRPLCLLPGNFCLVGDEESGVLAQINKHGESLGHIIKLKKESIALHSAVYDRVNERLVIGGESEYIFIYELSASK